MTGALIAVATLVGAGIIGAILHELTHWGVAWLLGRRATIDWWAFETRWQAGERLTKVDRAIGLAPLSLGLAAGLWAFTDPVTWPLAAWVAWGVYTLNGARSDFAPVSRDSDTDSPSLSS